MQGKHPRANKHKSLVNHQVRDRQRKDVAHLEKHRTPVPTLFLQSVVASAIITIKIYYLWPSECFS